MGQIHQHEFDSVEQYLHHRAPYLMVERINSMTDHEIVTEKYFAGNESFASGHFPGAKVFPGAMMQELCTQSAGILIAARHNPMLEFDTQDPFFNEYALGVLASVRNARYSGFARPGDTLVATVGLNEQIGSLFDFAGKITVNGSRIMRIQFRLSNIKSTLLQGKERGVEAS